MIIGSVRCECMIHESHSLKEKRSVIKSILHQTRNKLNLSCAETAHQDVWQRTEISFVGVSTSRTAVENELQRAISIIDRHDQIEPIDMVFEWL